LSTDAAPYLGRLERATGAVVAWTLPVVLIGIVPAAFHVHLPRWNVGGELAGWACLLMSAGRISWLAISRQSRLFDLAFWIFVYAFFGLSATAQIESSHYPLGTAGYSSEQILATQLRIGVGIAAYLVGTWVHHTFRRDRATTGIAGRLAFSERRWRWLTVAGLAYLAIEVGRLGLHIFFSSRYSLESAVFKGGANTSGYVSYAAGSKAGGSLSAVFITIPVLVALIVLLASGRGRDHKVLLIGLIGGNVVANNPISSPRAWTGVVAAGLLSALFRFRLGHRSALFALGLLLSLLVSLSYLDVFRAPETETRKVAVPSVGTELTASPDFGMFQQELNATLYTDLHGKTGGRQLLGTLFVFVPRSVWKTKAQPTGIVVSAPLGLIGNWSSSLWTELYIDFGYVELVLGFLGLGLVFSAGDHIFLTADSEIVRVAVPTLATFCLLLIRGSLEPVFGLLVPLVLAFAFCASGRADTGECGYVESTSETARLSESAVS
jgi:hypothetical protein